MTHLSRNTGWLGGVVVRSRTDDSQVVGSILTRAALSSNNREQVIYTHGAQANSAFFLPAVGKWVAISTW